MYVYMDFLCTTGLDGPSMVGIYIYIYIYIDSDRRMLCMYMGFLCTGWMAPVVYVVISGCCVCIWNFLCTRAGWPL